MSINRITGLASGIDTESMIKDLMKLEKSKIDNTERDKILYEWEQEAYRDVTKSIQAFQSEYFDLLNPETNFRSKSAFSEYTESVQVAGEDVSYVSVQGQAGIQNYNHTIGSITQLATKDKWTSDSVGIGNLSGDDFNLLSLPSSLEFSLTIDGNTESISIADTSGVADKDDLVALIDAEIQSEFGADYAGIVGADATEDAIYFRLNGSEITIMETSGNENDLSWLGFESGDSSTDYSDKSLFGLLGITNSELETMSINDVSLTDLGITQGSTISELTTAINSSSDVNVSFYYNSTSDSFSLTANDYGSANEIEMSADFMTEFGFVDDASHHDVGQNAMLELNGTSIVKSSNTFSIEGVQFSLNNTYDGVDGDINVAVDTDTDAIKEKIESFVETYNGLVGSISGKLSEKKNYDYEPLTTEEKEALSEEEIERWEDKAKSGLLRNDSVLSKMLTDMRISLYESVEGVGLTLADIGIQTTDNYKEGGKLVIDDEKLTEALENSYDDVVSLFTNESDKEYLDTDNLSERYQENGLAYRLYDIMQNNVRITRDSSGSKGTLLEKAGIDGDTSNTNNLLSEQIVDLELRIDDLWDNYYDQEERYYIMFGNMEAALSEMQSQSSSLMAQLG